MLTKDKAALRMNFYTQFKITNIEQTMLENKAYDRQLYILVQLALRSYVGSLTLDELLEDKDSVAEYVSNYLKSHSASLGVKIVNCGLRDIILPGGC